MEVFDVENDAQSVCTFSECVPLGSPKLLPWMQVTKVKQRFFFF
jgi:hypothetical protein